ncbi:poly(hydroxyalcanoate) granule associated protein (phasin) [Clostridium tepidiprofundi DSM 19306]|uniref:Poly(Hydroxyalcanoate) granule associated protein (Phasin) n=1 Tax=Clostridium tepidiprofundi DSM 19306 TaxID=1121338 RepID=A0A151B2C2_9CLOT|nr:phasin family protein [Clostridium tepidiprofundi]KYH33943.1 poly(hydroxyalcanoate) granule associated protein (phasin) [Clostridium tepidiprofundi DSM 19306]
MLNDFKKVVLFGIGSVADTFEKASKMVDEMVEKGKLTVNEGKELTEELKRNIKTKTEEVKDTVENKVAPLTKDDIVSILKEMNFASKDDINEIKERLDKLENK